jgi:hypothetical protein
VARRAAFSAASVIGSNSEARGLQGVKRLDRREIFRPFLDWQNLKFVMALPDLKSAQSDHGKQDAQNIKSHHHLGFVPPLFLEMMMDGSH